ncbi:MAG: 50S ribosomal protein L1 [Gammaproteobacteria bacterium]|jgi:large subunit ribosomal protein L1|nr:50S ribosomal protein L1 [Gammaproteobacteria bacterium]
MARLSKRIKAINGMIDKNKVYPLEEALALLKELSKVKFTESVDVSVNLGVDPRKSDQVVRGATVLPNGTGKEVRVAVFTDGDNTKAAAEAGADIVGMEDLAAEVKKGNLDFDVVIASPDAMRVVGQLGQILGPRGLMPNPKVGTVTADVATAVKNAKSGQVRYRVDKAGIIHASVGTVKFDVQQLQENINGLVAALIKAKPTAAKGVYLKKISVSTTMGPGLTVDQSVFL